jgi:hypothetical protein
MKLFICIIVQIDFLSSNQFGVTYSTGRCSNKNSFERSLKRFVLINLGEAEDKRFQLSEPAGRVLKSPGASLDLSKNTFRQAKKGIWATTCSIVNY